MVFIDSNIWLYGYTDTDPEKRRKATALVQLADVAISSQVINEVVVNLLRKGLIVEQNARHLVEELYHDYVVLEILRDDIITASELRDEYRLSYWDSLIASTALRGTADILYSEDMQDGLVIRDRVTIKNPF